MKIFSIIQFIIIFIISFKNIEAIFKIYFIKKEKEPIKNKVFRIIGLVLPIISVILFSFSVTSKPLVFVPLIIGILLILYPIYLLFICKKERVIMPKEYDVEWYKYYKTFCLSIIIGTILIGIAAWNIFVFLTLLVISIITSLIITIKEKKKYYKNAAPEYFNAAESYYDQTKYEDAVKYYEKACKLNYGPAQNALGVCYDLGKGVQEDKKKAFEYLLKSYNNDCSHSYSNLGYYYMNGIGTEVDYYKAFEAYMKATTNKEPKAYYYIGTFYEDGKGVTKDLEKAYNYYEKAKEENYTAAIYKLGNFYENGYVVAKDMEKATELYQLAADLGFGPAQDKIIKLNEEKLKAELDKIIGLKTVKEEVLSLQAFAKFQKSRKERNIKGNQNLTLHMIFKGNPGTGKTTIARTVANMFRNIGILKTNKVIEVDREQLVGKYVGHTAAQTKEKVEQALDGVLFIDEAYTLSKGGENDFGREAIDTLVKLMEDYRDRLVVILAGYSDEMENFLETNPGLRSRFPNIIEFPNYSTDELIEIALQFCDKNGYRMSDDAVKRLKEILNTKRFEPKFGNGRGVRNIFEKSVRNMARRIAQNGDYENISDEALQTLEASDMEI